MSECSGYLAAKLKRESLRKKFLEEWENFEVQKE